MHEETHRVQCAMCARAGATPSARPSHYELGIENLRPTSIHQQKVENANRYKLNTFWGHQQWETLEHNVGALGALRYEPSFGCQLEESKMKGWRSWSLAPGKDKKQWFVAKRSTYNMWASPSYVYDYTNHGQVWNSTRENSQRKAMGRKYFFKPCQQTEKRNWFLLCQKNKHHLCHLYYDVIVVKLTHRKFTKNQSHRLIEGVWVSVSDMEQLAFALDTLSHSSFWCSSSSSSRP